METHLSIPHTYSFYREHCERLISNGYHVIPVDSCSKRPLVKQWNTRTLTLEELHGFPGNTSIALQTHGLLAIDLDIFEISFSFHLRHFFEKHLGRGLVRIGEHPKMLLLYRYEDEIKKYTSPIITWRIPSIQIGPIVSPEISLKNQVEIIGTNQKFMAFGVHPYTKGLYWWELGRSPLSVSYTDLPKVSPKKLRKAMDALPDIIREFIDTYNSTDKSPFADHGELINSASRSASYSTFRTYSINSLEDSGGQTTPYFAPCKPKSIGKTSQAQLDVLRSLLEGFNPDQYDLWIKAGMAAHHASMGSREGFEIWDEWSSKSGSYPGRDPSDGVQGTLAKWASFGNTDGPKVGLRYLLKHTTTPLEVIHQKDETINQELILNPLEWYLNHFVCIERGGLIYDCTQPYDIAICKVAEKRLMESNKVYYVDDKPKSYFKKWLTHPKRMSAKVIESTPRKPRGLNGDKLNIFYQPTFYGEINEDKLSFFLEHIQYLFPIEKDYQWFMRWMAFTIFKSSHRSMVTPLHINPHQGTGRGWLGKLLRILLGNHNVTVESIEGIVNDKYHSCCDGSLLCIVNEAKDMDRSVHWNSNNRLKEILTEDRLIVGHTYGVKKYEDIYTNFLFFSNNLDALHIPEADRRINFFYSEDPPRHNSYYIRLVDLLDDVEFIQSVFTYLSTLDLSEFDYSRSYSSPVRRAIIDSDKSDLDLAISDFLEIATEEWYKLSDIECGLSKINPTLSYNIHQLTAALKHGGFFPKVVRDGKVTKRVWKIRKKAFD